MIVVVLDGMWQVIQNMTPRHILKTTSWAGDRAQAVKDLFHKHEDLGLDSQALTQDYRQK